jgi:hypothetical protein
MMAASDLSARWQSPQLTGLKPPAGFCLMFTSDLHGWLLLSTDQENDVCMAGKI